MSKPDWKDAPEWAQYVAQDETGDWYWFSHKPEWEENVKTYCSAIGHEKAQKAGTSAFKGRCIKRPKVKP